MNLILTAVQYDIIHITKCITGVQIIIQNISLTGTTYVFITQFS